MFAHGHINGYGGNVKSNWTLTTLTVHKNKFKANASPEKHHISNSARKSRRPCAFLKILKWDMVYRLL